MGCGSLGRNQCQLSIPTPGRWKEECGDILLFQTQTGTVGGRRVSPWVCVPSSSITMSCTPHQLNSKQQDGGSRSRQFWRHRMPNDQIMICVCAYVRVCLRATYHDSMHRMIIGAPKGPSYCVSYIRRKCNNPTFTMIQEGGLPFLLDSHSPHHRPQNHQDSPGLRTLSSVLRIEGRPLHRAPLSPPQASPPLTIPSRRPCHHPIQLNSPRQVLLCR